MNSNWKECKLGEAPFEIIDGDRGTNYPKQDEFNQDGYCLFLNAKNVTTDGFAFNECYFISKEKDEMLRKGKLQRNDIILTTRGTVGNIGFFNERIPYDNIRINSGMVIIRSDSKGILPEYTHQLFKYLKGDFDVFATGSAQPQLPIRDLKEIFFPLPPLPEQRAIAGVLSSLDDKIDLLHRQSKTLEGIAEALWRRMFVEEADPQWKKGKLGDMITSIESGRRPKGGIDPDLQFGIPSIGAENIIGIGNYEHNKTKYISEEFYFKMNGGKVQDFDVLIYKDGAYIGRKSMFACGFPFKQCCVNEHVFILRTKNINTQIFLYFLLEQEELEQLNANSAQPGLNQEAMKSFEISIPDEKYIEIFGSETKIIIEKIFFNSTQIRTLSRLRDTLLPKLMSGEVRVKMNKNNIGVVNTTRRRN